MKTRSALLVSTLIVLALQGCGKKESEHETKKLPITDKTDEELSFELNSELVSALETNNLNLFKEILKKNPSLDLNKILADGETLLTTVIKKDFREFRNYLLEKGASTERQNANKETPLIAAAMTCNLNSVSLLLDENVSLDKKDALGLTALHHAILKVDATEISADKRREYEDLAALLVKAGASVEITTADDKNAYRLAVEHGSQKLQELIRSIMEIEYGTPDVGTFRTVLKQGNANSLNFMLTRYPSMPLTYESINPLVLAMEYDNELTALKMIQLLMNYKVNVDGPKDAEVTPLIKAIKIQNAGFVNLFIQANANTNLFDNEGKSALFHAISIKSPDVVDSLLAKGALKKYDYKLNNVKFKFDACKVAKEIEKASAGVEKIKMAEIKKSLKCSSWWPF